MRLINAGNLLEGNGPYTADFFEDDIPPYAILSHTWGQQEVTLHQLISLNTQLGDHSSRSRYSAASQNDADTVRRSEGFAKILYSCKQALQDNLSYVWVDTCCIDKSSSAELREAINSMYRWYAEARVCYVYLSDLDPSCPYLSDDSLEVDQWRDEFCACKWFTRGWTLQELLAPPNVRFYANSWSLVGTIHGLATLVSKRTDIHEDVLLHITELSWISIAERVSWAAHRKTSRVEDRAYSLLGIFDINMPMLYGEGTKAFVRLQEEIIKSSTDQSIFAWDLIKDDPISDIFACVNSPLLADSPDNFAEAGDIVAAARSAPIPFEMKSTGLLLTTNILSLHTSKHFLDKTILILDCHRKSNPEQKLGLYVRKVEGCEDRFSVASSSDGSFCTGSFLTRIANLNACQARDAAETTLTLGRGFTNPWLAPRSSCDPLTIRINIVSVSCLKIVEAWPSEAWNSTSRTFSLETESITAAVILQHAGGETVALVVYTGMNAWELTCRGSSDSFRFRVGFVAASSAETACQSPLTEAESQYSITMAGIELKYRERSNGMSRARQIWIEECLWIY